MAQLSAEKNAAAAPAKGVAVEAPKMLTPNYINEKHSNATPLVATANGQLLWEIDFNTSVPPTPGREYAEGDVFCIIEASYALMNVEVTKPGRLIDTCVKQGQMVKKGDILGWLE